MCLRYSGFGDIPLAEERDTLLIWFLFLNSAYLADGGGNIDLVRVAPGELEGGKQQVVSDEEEQRSSLV